MGAFHQEGPNIWNMEFLAPARAREEEEDEVTSADKPEEEELPPE